MELVLFKDLLEDDAEPQYGLLEDREEPSVICLCCGSTVEYGDYEIIKHLPWIDFSSAVKQAQKSKYVVCMNKVYVRNAEFLDTGNLSQKEFEEFDYYNSENDDLWCDIEPNPFIAIVEAASEEDAREKAGERTRYDSRCLYAIKI